MLIIALPILWALTIHEYAHAYVAEWAGDPTPQVNGRLTFNPLVHLDLVGTLCFFFVGFGWAKPVPVNPYNFGNLRRDNILVSVAGVTMNIATAIVAALIYRMVVSTGPVPTEGFGLILIKWLKMSVRFNIVLAVFNLLPIPPLDGSHVVETFVPYKHAHTWAAFARMGPFILLFLIITRVVGKILVFVVWPVSELMLGP